MSGHTPILARAVACVLLFAGAAGAQVTVVLHQPPPNKLRVADLWHVSLTNASRTTYTVYLHGVATESKTGKVIIDAQTHPFPLAPGTVMPSGSQFGSIQVNSADERYRAIVLETGTVPSGDYRECVYVVNTADGAELASDCIDISVEQFTPPVLIAPADGNDVDDPIVLFTWVPPVPMVPGARFTYDLRIVEILSRQSPIESMTRNNVWFEESDVTASVKQYPASARAFVPGSRYAWKVTAYLNGLPVGESETWSFRRTAPILIHHVALGPEFPVRAANGGLGHSLAAGRDSALYAWGYNENGQLGVTMPGGSDEAVAVGSLRGIKTVSAGAEHSLAVAYDGKVYAWGTNECGQLGDNTTTDRPAPVPVPGLPAIERVAAGNLFSLALSKGGSVYFWGYDRSGEAGSGGNEHTATVQTPQLVPGLSGVSAIAAGAAHALAVNSKGEVYAWGNNEHGQLGTGSSSEPNGAPQRVTGITVGPSMNTNALMVAARGIHALAAGGAHSLALGTDGIVWAWGDNASGQLGDGTRSSRATPQRVVGLTEVIAIAAGGAHAMALRRDSTVWVWGGNRWGMLGLGASDSARTVPVQVPGLSKVIGIACGEGQSFAISSDGTLWGWGENTYGQVGTGVASDPDNPAVTDPTKPTIVKRTASK